MLCADKLGSLSENNRTSQIDDFIGHIADDTIRCQTAGRIGSAALNSHHIVGDIHRLTLHPRYLHRKLLSRPDTFGNGVCHAAKLLNTDHFHRLSGSLNRFIQPFNIRAFTAQADDQHCAHIRMKSQPDQCIRHPLQIRRKLAAALMVEQPLCIQRL